MRYDLSRQASAEIDNIIRYTDEHFGQDQTAEYVGGLYNSFEILSDNPRMGQAWDGDLKRRYIYRSHYVFYRILEDENRLVITDIRNTRQQIPPQWES